MKKLTERQTEILDFIQHYTKEHNYPPTFREIGKALFADETGIYYHLERLRDWGIVDWQPNVSRTLRIVQASSVLLRPAVQWFAEQMELKLRKNDHKGGWNDCTDEFLSDRLRDEVLELEGAVFGGGLNNAVIQEAADVANFALMIADNARSAIETTAILSEAEAV